MASSQPMKKNTATRIVFPIFDADGDLVSSAADLDSEYSLDGAGFSDCSNEATEIGSTGMYYLDLVAGETNGDVVAIIVKTSTSGAKTSPLVFYTAAQTSDETDAIIDGINSKVDIIDTNVDNINGRMPTNFVMGSNTQANMNDEIDAIKAKTDNLPADPASETNVDANEAKIDIIDTNVDSILADTGTDGVELSAGAVDDIWDELLTGATHNINTSAGKRLRQIQENLGYEGGAIWIDTVNGSPGTVNFENGTVGNPVDNMADANTLAASLGIGKFHVQPGSSVTFAASQESQQFEGCNWSLALGGQSISNTKIIGADITGIGTGASKPSFFDCHFGAVTLPPCHMSFCGLEGTYTIGSAGEFFFDRCHSGVAGISTPTLDFGAGLDASEVNFRGYSGGIEIENMGAGSGSYDMSLEGHGQLIINANCSATSLIAIRGHYIITDNAGGAVTLSDDARYDVDQINDECDTALSDYDPPTRTEATADKDEIIAEVDANETKIDAIKAVTDNLPDNGALSDLAAILADTNELQTDWTNGGRLDLLIDSIIQYLSNKCIVDVSGSKMDLYNDAGDAIIKTWALLDKDGSAISVGTGVPTQRGVPS